MTKLRDLFEDINKEINPKERNDDEGEITNKVSYKGKQFKLKIDVNKNPTKKGIKIQFFPLTSPNKLDTNLSKSSQDDFAIGFQMFLNEKLKPLKLEVDRDPDVPDENIIGFTLRLEFIDRIIRDILKGN
jgi:hypothetical protein